MPDRKYFTEDSRTTERKRAPRSGALGPWRVGMSGMAQTASSPLGDREAEMVESQRSSAASIVRPGPKANITAGPLAACDESCSRMSSDVTDETLP